MSSVAVLASESWHKESNGSPFLDWISWPRIIWNTAVKWN